MRIENENVGVLTGERVRIYAEDEEQMLEMLSNGDYEAIETETTVQFVSGPLGMEAAK
jgi:hypothetical protein